MKVWEKIAKDFPGNDFKSKEQILDGMYFYKWTPCECNEQHEFISSERMGKLCAKHDVDCMECLKEWLDTKI